MKKIIMLMLFGCSIALAAGPAPKELQGGVITVTLKDGSVYTFSSDEYAVVRRGNQNNVEQNLASKETTLKDTEKSFRLTLYAGEGFTGQSVFESGNFVEVNQEREFVGGLGLSYKFYKDYSVGATGLSNKTYLLNLSKDFK